MTHSSAAAGIPAADTYLRWREVGSWHAPADQRTLERERLEVLTDSLDGDVRVILDGDGVAGNDRTTERPNRGVGNGLR